MSQVRTVTHRSLSLLAGRTKLPVWTAPACRTISSPGRASSNAAWKSAPGMASIVLPTTGVVARSV